MIQIYFQLYGRAIYFFPDKNFKAPPTKLEVSPALVKSLFPVANPTPVAASPPPNTVAPTLK